MTHIISNKYLWHVLNTNGIMHFLGNFKEDKDQKLLEDKWLKINPWQSGQKQMYFNEYSCANLICTKAAIDMPRS